MVDWSPKRCHTYLNVSESEEARDSDEYPFCEWSGFGEALEKSTNFNVRHDEDNIKPKGNFNRKAVLGRNIPSASIHDAKPRQIDLPQAARYHPNKSEQRQKMSRNVELRTFYYRNLSGGGETPRKREIKTKISLAILKRESLVENDCRKAGQQPEK